MAESVERYTPFVTLSLSKRGFRAVGTVARILRRQLPFDKSLCSLSG